MTAAACTRVERVAGRRIRARPASGHGDTISRVSWNCDQISSVTCGITGWSSASSRSSAASAVAIAASSPA